MGELAAWSFAAAPTVHDPHGCSCSMGAIKKRLPDVRPSAQRLVNRVTDWAMLTKPVTPHVLRHTFAVNCVQRGSDAVPAG